MHDGMTHSHFLRKERASNQRCRRGLGSLGSTTLRYDT